MAIQGGPGGGSTFGPPQQPTTPASPSRSQREEGARLAQLQIIAEESLAEYKSTHGANEASMTPEARINALRAIFFRRVEASQADRITKEGWLSQPMEKWQRLWENMSPKWRTVWSTMAVGLGTVGLLWKGDYISGGQAVWKLAQKVGVAMLVNYSVRKLRTFRVVEGIKGWFNKNQPATPADPNIDTSKLDPDSRNKFNYIKWIAATAGVGLGAFFGGALVAIIAAGGLLAKGLIDYFYEKAVSEMEKQKATLAGGQGTTPAIQGAMGGQDVPDIALAQGGGIDRNVPLSPEAQQLVTHLANLGAQYDGLTRKINNKKFQKGVLSGVASMGSSVLTGISYDADSDVEAEQTQAQIKPGEKAPWEIETQPEGSAEAKAIAEAHAKFDAEHPSDKGLTPEEQAKKYPEAPFAKDVHEKSEVEPAAAEDKPEAKVDPKKVKEAEEELRVKKNELIKEKMDLEKAKEDLEKAEKGGKQADVEAKKEALREAEKEVKEAEKGVKGAEGGLEKAKTGEGSPDNDGSPDASAEEEKTIDVKDIEKEAVIGKGDGITYAFKRQLEENEDLAEKLKEQIGYEDKIGTPKFYMAVGKYYGYLDGEGHEIRTNYDADDKVAYQFREVDGKIVVDEITFEKGGDVGTIQETKGLDGEEDFENKDYEKPYEYNYGEEHHYSGSSKPDIEKVVAEDAEVKDLDGGDEYESQYSTSELAENKDGFEKIKEETWEEVKGMSALEYFTNVQDDKDAFNTLNAIYREAEARNDVPSLNELKALEEAGTPMSLEDLINKSRDVNHMNDLKEAREAQEELEKIEKDKIELEKEETENQLKEKIAEEAELAQKTAIEKIYDGGLFAGKWKQIIGQYSREFMEKDIVDLKRNHAEMHRFMENLASNLVKDGVDADDVKPSSDERVGEYLDYLIEENVKRKLSINTALEKALEKK